MWIRDRVVEAWRWGQFVARQRRQQGAAQLAGDRLRIEEDAVLAQLRAPDAPPVVPALDAETVATMTPDAMVAAVLERLGMPHPDAAQLPPTQRLQIAAALRAVHPDHTPLALALRNATEAHMRETAASVARILLARTQTTSAGRAQLARWTETYQTAAADPDSPLGAAFYHEPPLAARQAHEAWARAVR